MSSEFKSALNKSLTSIWNVVDEIPGTTSAHQDFVIVVNGVWLWFKVRLYLDKAYLKDGQSLKEYHCWQHANKHGAMEQVKWIKGLLQRYPFDLFVAIKSPLTNLEYYLHVVQYPDDCKENPGPYLKRGDHVQISRKGGLYHHAGVFLGNDRVIHIYDDNSKHCARAREDSWKNFVGVCDDGSTSWFRSDVSVIIYRLRIRTPDEIVSAAREMASESYGRGKYNFVLKNCQHFASFCCTGIEMSTDVHRPFETFISVLNYPTHYNYRKFGP